MPLEGVSSGVPQPQGDSSGLSKIGKLKALGKKITRIMKNPFKGLFNKIMSRSSAAKAKDVNADLSRKNVASDLKPSIERILSDPTLPIDTVIVEWLPQSDDQYIDDENELDVEMEDDFGEIEEDSGRLNVNWFEEEEEGGISKPSEKPPPPPLTESPKTAPTHYQKLPEDPNKANWAIRRPEDSPPPPPIPPFPDQT